MGELSSSSADSQKHNLLRSYWEGYKEFWGERFSFIQNYTRFTRREEPLSSWSDSDVNAFIAVDPVHGPALKSAREAVKFALVGSAIGAGSTAGIAWKYSRSLHGAGLALAAGAVFGWTFGQEVAGHYFQLYRMDTLTAQTKFLEWWEAKCERRS